MFWKCRNFNFDTRVPIIMGIVNVTPDSFSDGSKYFNAEIAIEYAKELVKQGAQIIDVGGESTRPSSKEVSPEIEWKRISEIVTALAREGICVSVDTRHYEVAEKALHAGASIINDISGFTDESMKRIVKENDCGLVVMHMRGNPQTMSKKTDYEDVVSEVREWLSQQTEGLAKMGIATQRICIDPGVGFAKNKEQSREIIRNMHIFRHLGFPVMVALSRKSFLDVNDEETADTITSKENLRACESGAGVVRVHNVPKTVNELKKLRPLVVLGLGANVAINTHNTSEVQDCLVTQLNQAITKLVHLPDTEIVDISPFYKSEPAYFEKQNDFVNCIVALRSGIPPLELLNYLHIIEESLGRVRNVENGPRTIDIDIEDYQMYVCDSESLTLPHKNICERDFVVKPFCDILPNHILADGTLITSIDERNRVGKAQRIFE